MFRRKNKKKEMGQNETKFSLQLPKKEMKLRVDLKAGNKTEGRGSRNNSAGTIRSTTRLLAARKTKDIKLRKEKRSLSVWNERLTNWPTFTGDLQRCSRQRSKKTSQKTSKYVSKIRNLTELWRQRPLPPAGTTNT